MKIKHVVFITTIMGLVLALCGCQQDVDSVGESPKKGQISLITPKAGIPLPESIPIRMKNFDVSNLKVEVSAGAPFDAKVEVLTPTIAEVILTKNKNPTTMNTSAIKVTNTVDGTVLLDYEVKPEQIDWRTYSVEGETYMFEPVKIFHCDGSGNLTISSSPAIFTKQAATEAVLGNSILSCTDNPSLTGGVDGVRVTFFHDSDKFLKGSYDYFEIKFKSSAETASTIKLHGNSSFEFLYDSGKMTSSGDSTGVTTTYKDSDDDWCILGFWNDGTNPACLYVEDFIAKRGNTTTAGTLSFNDDFTYMTVDSDNDSTTEIDYIAFYKKVEG